MNIYLSSLKASLIKVQKPNTHFTSSFRFHDHQIFVTENEKGIAWFEHPDSSLHEVILEIEKNRLNLFENQLDFHVSLTEEIIFFGGSFNPWHKGHQTCLDMAPPDKTLIIIPDHNPQKKLIKHSILDIYQNIRFNRPNLYCYPGFFLKEKLNPTIEWISRLKANFPEKKFSLLMGFDSLQGLHSWKRSDQLKDYFDNIYFTARKEDFAQRDQVGQRLKREMGLKNIFFLGHHDYEDLSSSIIRQKKGRAKLSL